MTQRKQFKEKILECLKNDSATTKELYDFMIENYVGLCIDYVDNDMEWKHTMRWAQQDLKNEGMIYYDEGKWYLE
jgi:hypothetical protein